MIEQKMPRIFLEFSVNPLSPSECEVLYDVTRLATLANYLKKPLSGDAAKALFAQIADLLGTCSNLGLPLKNVLLDANEAYYDSWSGSLRFVCLPFGGIEADVRKTQAFFMGLSKRMIAADEVAHSLLARYDDGLRRIPGFNPIAYRSLLLELAEVRGAVKPAKVEPRPSSQPAKRFVHAASASASLDRSFSAAKGEGTTVLSDAVTPSEGRHARVDPGTGVLDAVDWRSLAAPPVGKELSGLQAADDPGTTVLDAADISSEVLVPQSEPALVRVAPVRFWLTRERTGERFEVRGDRFVVGKSKYSTYQVKDTTTISRSHAVLHCDEGDCWIEDNLSKNGTSVDGERLEPHVRMLLHSGAVVRMSDEDFTFEIVRCKEA